MPGIILLFALIAWASPIGFWYHFWMSPVFRGVVVTTGVAMAIWTGYMMLASHGVDGWRGRAGGVLAAARGGLRALPQIDGLVQTLMIPARHSLR